MQFVHTSVFVDWSVDVVLRDRDRAVEEWPYVHGSPAGHTI